MGVLVLAATLAGCGRPLESAQQSFLRGDFEAAADTLGSAARQNRSGSDAVVLWLEYASVLHHLGRYEESSEAFRTAEARIEAIDSSPSLSVSEQTRVALTNPEETVYRATGAERVMAPTLRALNAMLSGDQERARQAFVAAGFQRQYAEDRLSEEIADARRAAQQSTDRGRVDQTLDDPQAQAALQERYARIDQFQPYTGYANPFSEWLQAVYLLAVRGDPADVDQAWTLLNRLSGMLPDSALIERDFASAEAARRGDPLTGVTYVIFATGTAPMRAGERIDLPLFLVNREVDYVGIAIPVLRFNDAYDQRLLVRAGGSTAETALVADMDRIVSADFRAERGALIARQIAGAITKAAAAWGVNQAAEQTDSPWVALLVRLGTIFYQVSMNRTDNRAWVSMPKQFQAARVPTPASGTIELRRGSGETHEVEVASDGVNIVYARSVGPGLPMTVDSATLRPAGAAIAAARPELEADDEQE